MASISHRQLFSLTVALLVGLFIGFFIRDFKFSFNQLIPAYCNYEGRTYKSGEGFKATDGCNSCSCSQGEVNCTLIACNDRPPESLPPRIPPDEPPIYDSVITPPPSAVNENNELGACTMEAKICPDGSEVGRSGPNCEFEPCPEFQQGYPSR